jgi:uncharacterized protein DUF2690
MSKNFGPSRLLVAVLKCVVLAPALAALTVMPLAQVADPDWLGPTDEVTVQVAERRTASVTVRGCSGSGCDGQDPSVYCHHDATTADSTHLGPALLELRYSPSCRAAWARISDAPWVDNDTFPSFALVHRDSDGREYRCEVPKGQTSCYTAMVNDANVTSYAYGEWDGGARIFKGRTGSH